MNHRVLRAPWTDDQVATINRFQTESGMHPFTCRAGNRTDEAHGKARGRLVATRDGFVCTGCDYTQDWCDPEMANTAQVERVIRYRAEILGPKKPEPAP